MCLSYSALALTFQQALENVVTAIIDEIAEELQEKVYDVYPTATGAANSEANQTVRKWG
jgi:predicted nuclease with RNAse H fold